MAAGAVVLRDGPNGPQVLTVHRPRYDDISLPKGHLESGEDAPVAAVREVLEETGVKVRLTAGLQPIEYDVPHKGGKMVQWWRARVCAAEAGEIDRSEVDEVLWLDVGQARERLSYHTDVQVLEEALEIPPTMTILMVRHAKAVSRKEWGSKKGNADDTKRPLDRRGHRQAKALRTLLDAYGVTRLVSSPSKRCMQTLQPFAKDSDIEITECPEFTEETFEAHHKAPKRAMKKLVAEALDDPDSPLAICGHRPVLPSMGDVVHSGNHPMSTAECLIVHLDHKGRAVRQEWHRPSV
ncbi:putative 8-oxo-dGTP diphosphatase 1 [Acidipropionibacterium virtanenii]|uniref:Putative 8-oxo-dGTP diphosphatase 1 n=2 Tax=Acidipropionibacterium virtanenii TaxID=2057246 RepID=A0A344URN0_9ACTN|nr:putative 8-oxo-dGTP diphosphatase 1 [Acidipropionibacterium virtanenii]